MKTTKKVLSLLLVVAMILTLAIPAFAAEEKTATKITSAEELVSGEYIMVANNGIAMKAIEGTWVTFADLKGGVDPATAPVWTLTVDGSSVKIADANGVYLAPKGGGNNGIATKEYAWTVSFEDGAFTFNGSDSKGTYYLACNTIDTTGFANCFRGYKATTVGDGTKYPYHFSLYKLDAETPAGEPGIEITDCGVWGEGWPNAYNLGWKYVDFDYSQISEIRVGMQDADGAFLVEYSANGEQLAYQQANGYITEAGLSSAPFYQAYNGVALTEEDGEDWSVEIIDAEAFAAWQPALFYVVVETVDGESYVDTAEYNGPYAEPYAPGEYDGKIVILHSNDVHGSIEGYAKITGMKTLFEELGATVILADAGDYSQGTSYVSTSKGGSAIAMMNVAGYDVATLGNHEFDYGWAQLKDNMKCAEFNVVCADVLENGEPVFDGHTIIEKNGVKIGFFGMETPEAQTKANPALIQGLTFLAGDEMYACAQAQVDALKAEGADVVICLAHLGIDAESAPNRSVDMLANVEGIDFLIDGHSHSVLEAGPNGEAMQSTGTAFANVGAIVIDVKDKAVEENFLIPITNGEYTPDAAVAADAQDIIDRVNAEYGQVFAKSEVELNGDKAPGNRNMETNLGDLITDSMVWQVMQNKEGIAVDADNVVAITNGGGIRAWIHQGDITKKDVNTVLPFGNTIAVVYVTGAELLEALEASTYCTPGAVGGFPQVAGIDFTIAAYKDYDANAETYPASTYYGPASINRVTINSINGKDFDPEATYAVITNNFCAAGGDTYYAFAAASAQFDTGVPLDEALMAYITEALDGVVGQQYAEPQGRITVLSEEPAGEFEGKTVILHSNDVHGAIAGYANMAALKAEYEAKGATVILADAGDFSQGTTYVSTTKGADAVAMMNAAGYDVATLGNHEFDYGWAQLKDNMSKADFKVLCADVLENGKTVFDGHTIIEKGGVKIGFFGMETPEAQTKTNPALIQGLTFLAGDEMYACAQAQVDALKAEGADVVICLAHLGLDNESAPNRSVDMLDKVDGIDMVIDGHSHTVISKCIVDGDIAVELTNGEKIQSTGTAFANIGVIVVDNATKAIVDNYLVPVAEDSAKDAAVAAAAQAIIDAINEEYGKVFAKSEVELNGDKAPGNRNMETNLGDLITDSMVWQVMQNKEGLTVDADHVVAITNGGGIRAWIHQGDITMNDVHTVLPFGNTIAVVYVTGAELLEALEASTYCTPTAVGGFPQVAGIDFSVATCAEYDANAETYPASTYYGPASINRVTINNINGKDFDPKATYAVITNNFCAAGGDTYYAFAAASAQFDTGVPLDEALMAYISEELGGVVGQQYAEPQGRISVGHPWVEITVPGCVTRTDLFGDEEGNIVAGTERFCPVCGEEEFEAYELNPADHSMDPFSDISASGYHDYIIAANLMGLAKGYNDGTFGPKEEVTRAQFVTMLWRMAGEPQAENTELSFADAAEIAAPYQAAVAWGVEMGIINGYGDGTFRPDQTISRAQMATFMYRFCGLIFGDEVSELTGSAGFVDEAQFDANYADAINFIANIGVMNGVDTAPTFDAYSTANRGMAATVLVRLELFIAYVMSGMETAA